MKLICGLTIVSAILAAGAAAQDDPAQAKLQVEKMMANAVIRLDGGVMGPAVKGAPYSADEIRETNETLADGTRIHNESKVTVYRDSEGRVRRETPDQISIWDPAAGTNYVLDPKTMTARKMMLHFVYSKTGEGLPNQNVTFTYRTMGGTLADAGGGTIRVGGTEGGAIAVAQAKVDADAKAAAMLDADKAAAAGFGVGTKVVRRLNAGAKEALGTQVMEGVSAEGERTTSTIEVGAIGN
ncbi:MAG TPA: hypothetical protein VGS58_17685, partial [Candidatus Sulfopaludibacter sp.]|nr:hypothetical protein [Candidatus Sulfopaludibacter sp.]